MEKIGVSARVMNNDHNLIGCAALPGLKLLRGCLQRRRDYDDTLVVREYSSMARMQPHRSELQLNIEVTLTQAPLSSLDVHESDATSSDSCGPGRCRAL